MNRILSITLIIAAAAVFFSCTEKNDEYKATAKQYILNDIDSLHNAVEEFIAIAGKESNRKPLQDKFMQCRLLYKKCEWAIEYFVPETARFINGPALDELELEENRDFPPHGFQVIEELLYPEYSAETNEELVREVKVLLSNIKQVRNHLEAVTISPNYVMDATRLQVYRVLSLGITGFDSPVALASIPETKAALEHIPEVLATIQTGSASDAIVKDIKTIVAGAIKYCSANSGFDDFDRSGFITGYLNPLSKKLAAFQRSEKIATVSSNRALKADADYYFAKNAFDADAFIPSAEYSYSDDKAKLGEKLFYDNRLSKENNRNCATCHKPELAFTDGLKTNLSLKGINLRRNTPTLTYASLQHGQFWDLRQPDLEKQTVDVIENREEMHGSMTVILERIAGNKEYAGLFKKAFNTDKPEAWQVQNALASYVRSLNAFDSRFDRYMRGEKNILTQQEISGMNIYMGKAKCATCHFTPLFGGTVPPNFVKTEHEVIGTPKDAAGTMLSEDLGRYIFNQMPQLKNAYKTPTLRNVAVTAPYMHNGVYSTLEEVVDFYNKGGGLGLGLTVDNQTLPPDKLNLTESEMKALVAFMKTLTDKKYE